MRMNTVEVFIRGSEEKLKTLREKLLKDYDVPIYFKKLLDPKDNLWRVQLFDLPMMKPIRVTRPDGEEVEINVDTYRLRFVDSTRRVQDIMYSSEEFQEALAAHYNDIAIDKGME